MSLTNGYEIERCPDGVATDSPAAEELLGFWTLHGVLEGERALARLPHVVCLLRDAEGRIAASSAAVEADVATVGGRRFWLLRCFAPDAGARACVDAIAEAAYGLLAERRAAGSGPLGVCLPVADPRLVEERDEAVWPVSRLLFAGWSPAGEQLRLRYFDGAVIL